MATSHVQTQFNTAVIVIKSSVLTIYQHHVSNLLFILDYRIIITVCDDNCATCFRPYDPAQCTSCRHGYKLNGNYPTNCLPKLTKCWGANYYNSTTDSCESDS